MVTITSTPQHGANQRRDQNKKIQSTKRAGISEPITLHLDDYCRRDVSGATHEGNQWHWQEPGCSVLGWTNQRRRSVHVVGFHHRTLRLSLRRRGFLPRDQIPHRLPVQTPKGDLHYQDLPSQCQQQRVHLPGSPEDAMVSSPDRLQTPAVYLLPAHWPQSGRPSGPRYR